MWPLGQLDLELGDSWFHDISKFVPEHGEVQGPCCREEAVGSGLGVSGSGPRIRSLSFGFCPSSTWWQAPALGSSPPSHLSGPRCLLRLQPHAPFLGRRAPGPRIWPRVFWLWSPAVRQRVPAPGSPTPHCPGPLCLIQPWALSTCSTPATGLQAQATGSGCRVFGSLALALGHSVAGAGP